jgi:hypothetical protein
MTVPATTPLGSYNAAVINPDHSKAVCTGCLTIIATPTITSMSPSSAAQGTNTSITLTGTGFAAGASLKGPGGVTFANVQVVNSSTITATMQTSATAPTGTNLPVAVTNDAAAGYGTAIGNVLTVTKALWGIVPSPNPFPSADVLQGVSCVSVSYCMAVGQGSSPFGLILHWDGSTWTNSTNAGTPSLDAVSCVSTTFCMAVGATTAEKWDGTMWTPIPTVTSAFRVSCTSPSFCVAVGNPETIQIWNGSSWTTMAPPSIPANVIELNDVSCFGTSTCIAIGYTSEGVGSQALVLSVSGGTWSLASDSGDTGAGAVIFGVSCTSATFCVLSGSTSNGALVLGWNGSVLSAYSPPVVPITWLWGVSCVSTSSCVAVGYQGPLNSGITNPVIEEWDGSSWTVDNTPSTGLPDTAFLDASCPAAGSCVAVGYTEVPSPMSEKTLVEMKGIPS